MKIEKSPLPENSAAAHYPNVDYSDSFRCRLPKAAAIRPDDLMLAFWTTMPGWLRLLFRVRNLLVKPFGLKTGEDVDTEALREALETGGSCHIMSVAEKTPRGKRSSPSTTNTSKRGYRSTPKSVPST